MLRFSSYQSQVQLDFRDIWSGGFKLPATNLITGQSRCPVAASMNGNTALGVLRWKHGILATVSQWMGPVDREFGVLLLWCVLVHCAVPLCAVSSCREIRWKVAYRRQLPSFTVTTSCESSIINGQCVVLWSRGRWRPGG